MLAAPDVLVVDDSLDRRAVVRTLKTAGYRVTSAGTFEQAAEIIGESPPHVLITEVRLGAFNGLHLILRCRTIRPNTVAIVHTAYPDPVLEAEARLLDADFLARPVDESALLALVAKRLGQRPERRRSARKQVNSSHKLMLMGASADLVDVSRHGFRFRLRGDELQSPLEVRFPALNVSVSARIVWAQHPPTDRTAFLCGAELDRQDRSAAAAWKRVVRTV